MVVAKATEVRADPFALKPSAGMPGALSARSFGHGTLVPHAAELGIDLGVHGRALNEDQLRGETGREPGLG
jgi:hypothetical protein